MTDQTEKPKLGTRPPLGLKRTVETGKVKQSFSHGRSNTVVVEVKKRRILGKPGEAPAAPKRRRSRPPRRQAAARAEAGRAGPGRAATRPVDDITTRKEMQERLLREAEEARMTSLEEARRRDDRVKVGADRGREAPRRGQSQGRGRGRRAARPSRLPRPSASPPRKPSAPRCRTAPPSRRRGRSRVPPPRRAGPCAEAPPSRARRRSAAAATIAAMPAS